MHGHHHRPRTWNVIYGLTDIRLDSYPVFPMHVKGRLSKLFLDCILYHAVCSGTSVLWLSGELVTVCTLKVKASYGWQFAHAQAFPIVNNGAYQDTWTTNGINFRATGFSLDCKEVFILLLRHLGSAGMPLKVCMLAVFIIFNSYIFQLHNCFFCRDTTVLLLAKFSSVMQDQPPMASS